MREVKLSKQEVAYRPESTARTHTVTVQRLSSPGSLSTVRANQGQEKERRDPESGHSVIKMSSETQCSLKILSIYNKM